jgi:putative transposase
LNKRLVHSGEFKTRVAMEAIRGRKAIQEIAADHAVQSILVSQWKQLLLEGVGELFTRGKLQMELEWLNKNHSCGGAHELRIMVSIDAPYLGLPEKGKPIAVQLVSAAQSW